MDIHPIKTDDDYLVALKEIERLWDAPEGSEDADKLDILSTLVDEYEAIHYPIKDVDPIELVEYALGDMGRTREEFVEIVGSKSHASEILNRKRPLTLDMIRKISSAWSLPIELLVAPYELASTTAQTSPAKRKGKRAIKAAPRRLRKTRTA
jgi:HTH-type transcriptional regulator/antitoxin HigA